ncbi:MAG: hypothetical protein AAGU32_20820, partial [Bacillota bacterium]
FEHDLFIKMFSRYSHKPGASCISAVGNLLMIHCAGGCNGVVITDIEGFTAIGRPIIFKTCKHLRRLKNRRNLCYNKPIYLCEKLLSVDRHGNAGRRMIL